MGTGIICDVRQGRGHWLSRRQKSQSLRRRLWKIGSFQTIAGMLSGPKALAGLMDFRTVVSSLMVNGCVGISKGSDIFVLGSECVVGVVGSLPRRLRKCSLQLDIRASLDPPLSLMAGLEALPEISEMDFQAALCCFVMWRCLISAIFPLM